MPDEFWLFGITSVIAIVLLFFSFRNLKLQKWKQAVVTCFGLGFGFFGTMLMFFFENGTWVGKSLYGGIFLAPVGILLGCSLLCLSADVAFSFLDLAAPIIMVCLAYLKIICLKQGCCGGIVLSVATDGTKIRFPSQIVEFICNLILGILLFLVLKSGKKTGRIYELALISYGIIRFILNFFRDADNYIGPILAGHLWSIVSIVAGCLLYRFHGSVEKAFQCWFGKTVPALRKKVHAGVYAFAYGSSSKKIVHHHKKH